MSIKPAVAITALIFAIAPAPLAARDAAPLASRVTAVLAAQGPGTRFGLVVTAEDGSELVAITPDARFVPASNTKIFTTAAAFETVATLDQPDRSGGATVHLERGAVVLAGHGDARLSSAADCVVDCLATLADAVAAKTRSVSDVIGDDSAFADERWSPGMSWNNIPTRSGTGISALTLDENEVVVLVSPGKVGEEAVVADSGYSMIESRIVTVTAGKTDLRVDRLPGDRVVRLSGTIATGAAAETLRLGIDDPAHHAAWRFAAMLRARGVRIAGAVRARHRPAGAAPTALETPIAHLTAPPLLADLTTINKTSQNVHAELLLRRIGGGSIAEGQKRIGAMLERAGVARWTYDFADGSGMSSYNRVTPRATVRFLRWAAAQPWGATWRATLPVAGVDGTLARRFVGGALAGRLFAKTGSLNGASALSGYMIAASGRTLTFASFAADMPEDKSATKAIDAALTLIAAEN
jgi:D-alanyl-D-alanine carboxypeptidase/D-alanyl-D-alanine-endopeptidase (penicillin-binding protein 4)